MHNISISKVSNSNRSNIDFSNLSFGEVFSDHMFISEYRDGKWCNPRVEPLKPLSVHPGNIAWHYGQSIFEGMKASKDIHGNPLLFRPDEHARRINESAERMCIPPVPEDLFIDAVHHLVHVEKDWIPTDEGSALYLRPIIFATDDILGVRASKTYTFIILALPVGPYYPKPVRLKAEDAYIRASVGGTGAAKTAGNYAKSLLPTINAKKEGFDQIMWLDSKEFKYVQEVGTMNIFFVFEGDKVVTPATDGAILKGITRKSVIHRLKDQGYSVEERPVTIDELYEAHAKGQLKEVFGTGTAVVISMVSHISHKGRSIDLDIEKFSIAPMMKQYVNDLRAGKIEDDYGWIVPVEIKQAACCSM